MKNEYELPSLQCFLFFNQDFSHLLTNDCYNAFLHSLPPVLPKTPTLTASSNSSVLLTSSKLILTCKSGSTDHITYKFQLNGQDVKNSGTGSTYAVPSTVSDSASNYTCVAIYKSARSSVSNQSSVRFLGESTEKLVKALTLMSLQQTKI